jgi:O-succinylbenzoate synthase
LRIEKLQLHHIRLPLVHAFETSFAQETVRDILIVKAWGDGLVGYGESASMAEPFYNYETTETCWHIQRDFLIPWVLERDIDDAGELVKLFAPVRGHNMAKTGIEQAWWDLLARAEGRPLSHLLGGTKERVESGVSIGIQESVEHLLERISSFLEQGYRRIKIKIKPGWDIDVVERVRQLFPEVPLMLDANSAYTLADADLFKALDDYDLMMIEQPLGYDDIFDHAELQSQIKTPICLDESITTPEHARWAIELGACRIINIKPARVGGLYQARRIHDICQQHDMPVWCGGLLESGIGRAHNVAICSLPNFRLPADLSASSRYYARDIVVPPWELNADGTISVPTEPGIGVEVDEGLLETFTIRKQTFPT